MSKKVKKPHENKSVISEYTKKSRSVGSLLNEKNFLISFKHIDRNQAASFEEWQDLGILARSITTLSNYCCATLDSQVDKEKFCIYNDFPVRSAFTHPQHVPEDAKWARIHITGKQVVAGHIVENVFYVVFLDTDHQFYLTELKNT